MDPKLAKEYAQTIFQMLDIPIKISIDANESEIPLTVICGRNKQRMSIAAHGQETLTLNSWKGDAKITITIESKDLNKSISFNLDTPKTSSDLTSATLGTPFPLEEEIGKYHLTIANVRRTIIPAKLLKNYLPNSIPQYSNLETIEFTIPIKIKSL